MNKTNFLPVVVVSSLLLGSPAAHAAPVKEKLTAEEVIRRHLESIGPAAARAAARTRILGGRAQYRQVISSAGSVAGPMVFASDGAKVRCTMKFDHPEYKAEEFAFTGGDPLVGSMKPGRRSPLSQALQNYQEMLREGLFGGALSTAWTFLNPEGRNATLTYEGTKQVDGRPAHAILYRPKRGSGTMKITLYFDEENFRHVRTTYKVILPRGLGPTPDASPLVRENRFTFEETFSGFQAVERLTLPTKWTIQYTSDGPAGTQILEWAAWVESVTTNDTIPAETFVLE